jgi:hypothetical protein
MPKYDLSVAPAGAQMFEQRTEAARRTRGVNLQVCRLAIRR